MHKRMRRIALAFTAAAVVAIAGGVTYAVADIGGGGVINGCYKSQNGQLRLIDPATDRCLPSETAISWSQTGPQGPQGPPAPQGPTGPQGPAGPQRSQGPAGPVGPAGSQGPKDQLSDGSDALAAACRASAAPAGWGDDYESDPSSFEPGSRTGDLRHAPYVRDMGDRRWRRGVLPRRGHGDEHPRARGHLLSLAAPNRRSAT
jgi:hypothetical protein